MMPSIPQKSLVEVDVSLFSVPSAGPHFIWASFHLEGLHHLDYDDFISTTQLNLGDGSIQGDFFSQRSWEVKTKTPWRQALNPATPRTDQLIPPWRGRDGELVKRMDAGSLPENTGSTIAVPMGGTEQCLLRI